MTAAEWQTKSNSDKLEYLQAHEMKFVPLGLSGMAQCYQAKIGDLSLGYAYPNEQLVADQAVKLLATLFGNLLMK